MKNKKLFSATYAASISGAPGNVQTRTSCGYAIADDEGEAYNLAMETCKLKYSFESGWRLHNVNVFQILDKYTNSRAINEENKND